jgi:hypothetical protein
MQIEMPIIRSLLVHDEREERRFGAALPEGWKFFGNARKQMVSPIGSALAAAGLPFTVAEEAFTVDSHPLPRHSCIGIPANADPVPYARATRMKKLEPFMGPENAVRHRDGEEDAFDADTPEGLEFYTNCPDSAAHFYPEEGASIGLEVSWLPDARNYDGTRKTGWSRIFLPRRKRYEQETPSNKRRMLGDIIRRVRFGK